MQRKSFLSRIIPKNIIKTGFILFFASASVLLFLTRLNLIQLPFRGEKKLEITKERMLYNTKKLIQKTKHK